MGQVVDLEQHRRRRMRGLPRGRSLAPRPLASPPAPPEAAGEDQAVTTLGKPALGKPADEAADDTPSEPAE